MKQTTAMRVFVASPGDVEKERDALARVLTDVNLALESLAPQQPFLLQLVRWETHVHPDFGRPQGVINEQIGDYDVFVGIMWNRFGTATGNAGSGTEEEFRLAYDRWGASGVPRILFYFSESPRSSKYTSAEVDQLMKVTAFREELSERGLVKSYASPDEFSDVVRRDLIRLVGRMLYTEEIVQPDVRRTPSGPDLRLDLVRPQIIDLANEYEALRAKMSPGDKRTQALETIAARMRALAADVYPLLSELVESESDGQRLAAVSLLEVIPSADHLDWLQGRLQPNSGESRFIMYHAAVALLTAVRELDSSNSAKLAEAVREAMASTADLPPGTTRARVVKTAHDDLRHRFP